MQKISENWVALGKGIITTELFNNKKHEQSFWLYINFLSKARVHHGNVFGFSLSPNQFIFDRLEIQSDNFFVFKNSDLNKSWKYLLKNKYVCEVGSAGDGAIIGQITNNFVVDGVNWVQLPRDVIETEIASTCNLLKVYIFCFIRKYYKPGGKYKVNQLSTGYKIGATACGVSISTFRRQLSWLNEIKALRVESNTHGTVITVLPRNFDFSEAAGVNLENSNVIDINSPKVKQAVGVSPIKSKYAGAQEMHEDINWKNQVLSYLHNLGYKSIGFKELYAEIEMFWQHLQVTGETHTPVTGRKHFINWLCKKMQYQRPDIGALWDGKGMMPGKTLRKVN